jgi:NitT/TauT family transport system substrate-binding protein
MERDMTLALPGAATRRDVLRGLAALGAILSTGRAAGAGAEPLVLWGLPATPSVVFARAVASPAFQDASPGARMEVWSNTDQLRAGIASGRFGLFATSTYAAANFFNRGTGTRMLNVVSWGVLYVMARTEGVTRIGDLAGKTVLLTNKNEAPDLLFRLLLRWSGLDPDRDVTLDYVGSPAEAVPLYLSGRADVAVLHEPAATAALLRAGAEGMPLFRAIDVTEAYGALTGRPPRIPQVGLAVSERLLEERPDIVAAAQAACMEAGGWAVAHPAEAGALGAPLLGLPEAVIARSVPFVHLDVTPAGAARADIEAYFGDLMSLDPGIVGGRLPDPAFYLG